LPKLGIVLGFPGDRSHTRESKTHDVLEWDLGELSGTSDGERLTKRNHALVAASPRLTVTSFSKPTDRAEEPLYTGQEDFPTPRIMKKSAAGEGGR
jgi:hypothetical protein